MWHGACFSSRRCAFESFPSQLFSTRKLTHGGAMPVVTSLLGEHLDRLAAFEPTTYPFLSLYLNTQADEHGKNNFQAFIRKEFHGRANTYPAHTPERQSFDRDTERIQEYLRDELRPSANG